MWVKIWLQILLPERPRQKIVLTKQHAEELLAQLRGSGNHEKTKQLEIAYQRLWDNNEYESYSEIRRNLFRFVFCWREPVSVQVLTKALQTNNERGELNDETYPEQRVRDLGADFLTFDENDKISFPHDSARDFISRLVNEANDDLALFRKHKTHRQVLRLFIRVFASFTQPDPFVADLARYFFMYLSYHCERSIQDALIYDEEWEDIFDGVLALYIHVYPSMSWDQHMRLPLRTYIREKLKLEQVVGGEPQLFLNISDTTLHESVDYDAPITMRNGIQDYLNWIPIILGYPWTKNISDERFESLGKDREHWDEQERYLQRKLESTLISHNLAIAVIRRDVSAASFLLHGCWSLQESEGVLDLIEDTVVNSLSRHRSDP